jgi:ABC-type taurine transport system substrate-binding protein
MKKTIATLLAGAAFAVSGTAANAAGHELTVAYFLEWPTPNQFAQNTKAYDEALGMKVNWVSFDAWYSNVRRYGVWRRSDFLLTGRHAVPGCDLLQGKT